MNKARNWMSYLRYGGAGLILIGFIGLAATMLPDYDYELWQAYLFAGTAMTGFAVQLVWAAFVITDWIRSRGHQVELFDWVRKWWKSFVWLMLGGVAGRALFGEALDMHLWAGFCQAVAEIGLICLAICAIVQVVERKMKKAMK